MAGALICGYPLFANQVTILVTASVAARGLR